MTDGGTDTPAERVAGLARERVWSVGTAFIAVFTPQGEVVAEHRFDGPPEAGVEQARDHAPALLAEQLAL